jgi:hypothetical protein
MTLTIDKLIEAVEAGNIILTRDAFDVWSERHEHWDEDPAAHAIAASMNDINAAKALHDVLLPGVRVEIFFPTDNWGVHWGVTLPGIDTVFGPDLARAWLLAILKAKQAEGRE